MTRAEAAAIVTGAALARMCKVGHTPDTVSVIVNDADWEPGIKVKIRCVECLADFEVTGEVDATRHGSACTFSLFAITECDA